MSLTLVVVAAVVGAALIVTMLGLRLVNEYQRGVVFRLGRMSHMKSPGLRLVIPVIDRVVRVDLRAVHFEVPSQDVITQDNVLVTVSAVVYIQVVNPPLAVTKVVDYRAAASNLVQSSLRSTLGQVALGDLLTGRDKVNALLARVINEELEPWGIQTTAVEIKDVLLPETMLRALGREAEAEREIRAKQVVAEGEIATARVLTDAAGTLAESPSALQLRYLQTLSEIGNERSTVIVFPVPIDLVQPVLELRQRARHERAGGDGDRGGASDAPARASDGGERPQPVQIEIPPPRLEDAVPPRMHVREPVDSGAGEPPPPPPPPSH
jgi:regulator of protease activity HflC (stomatin/prohibitin superfamily)